MTAYDHGNVVPASATECHDCSEQATFFGVRAYVTHLSNQDDLLPCCADHVDTTDLLRLPDGRPFLLTLADAAQQREAADLAARCAIAKARLVGLRAEVQELRRSIEAIEASRATR